MDLVGKVEPSEKRDRTTMQMAIPGFERARVVAVNSSWRSVRAVNRKKPGNLPGLLLLIPV